MCYRAILFDADETLFDFQAGNRNAVNRLMDEIGYFDPNRYDQYETINLECWRALEKGMMTHGQLQIARFVRFFDRYPAQGDPKQAASRFLELLSRQSILLPHALEVVEAIAAQLPVVIVTNGATRTQKGRMALSPLKELISGMVISQEIGVSKPSPGIFYKALDGLGVRPRDALMIGDGLDSDIRGANAAGIDACWYNPAHRTLPEGVRAEYVISDIRQCVNIALGD